MKAALLGTVVEADWYEKGIPSKWLVESWSLNFSLREEKQGMAGKDCGTAVASDGKYLYVHGPFGLAKVGSGFSNTEKVGDEKMGENYVRKEEE